MISTLKIADHVQNLILANKEPKEIRINETLKILMKYVRFIIYEQLSMQKLSAIGKMSES